MKAWVYLITLTCTYGSMKSVHPASHFLTQYLEGPWMNLTHTQVNNQVYPVWTYSYLCFLPVIFIIAVYVRHKPIIILENICLIVTWCLLLWVRTLWAVQLMQVAYGIATATEIGYDTYIYAKVPRNKYQQATSYIHAAVLAGRLISAGLAQILISTRLLGYRDLNYVSLGFSVCAAFLALLLPSTKSIGFEPDTEQEYKTSNEVNQATLAPLKTEAGEGLTVSTKNETKVEDEQIKCCSFWYQLWLRVKKSYSEPELFEWSIWWALGLCGSLQVGNYIQPLWEEIYPLKYNQDLYNGAVDAVKILLCTLVTLILGHLNIDWTKYGKLMMGLASALDAAVLFIMSWTDSIAVAYVTYCVFRMSHQMVLTIARFQVAKGLPQVNQPLIFGCNTFLALLFQTLLTVIVVDKQVLGLSPRVQFMVYSSFFAFVSALFLMLALCRRCKFCKKFGYKPTSPNRTIGSPDTELSC